MALPKTRLTRAIRALKKAAGSRPFVLVIEMAHEEAPLTNVKVHSRENMAAWQVKGLLHHGLDAPFGPDAPPCDEECS